MFRSLGIGWLQLHLLIFCEEKDSIAGVSSVPTDLAKSMKL